MVGGLACRAGGGVFDVTLQTVIADVAQRDRAAFHREILLAVDSVTNGRKHIDGGVLDRNILAGFDAVFDVSIHVERTFLLELGVSFDIECAFLLTGSSVFERVRSAGNDLYVNAFAVLHMQRCSRIDR